MSKRKVMKSSERWEKILLNEFLAKQYRKLTGVAHYTMDEVKKSLLEIVNYNRKDKLEL